MMMPFRSVNGFTLVEVLVAMAIFSIGILAVINMQLVASRTNLKARYMTEGVVVAQSKIEELSALAYDHADLTPTNVDDVLDTAEDSTSGLTIEQELATTDKTDFSHPLYKLGWNIVEDYPYDDTKTIRVIVKWNAKTLKQSFALDMVKSDGD